MWSLAKKLDKNVQEYIGQRHSPHSEIRETEAWIFYFQATGRLKPLEWEAPQSGYNKTIYNWCLHYLPIHSQQTLLIQEIMREKSGWFNGGNLKYQLVCDNWDKNALPSSRYNLYTVLYYIVLNAINVSIKYVYV